MASQPGPSTSAAIFRNDDLLSLALRQGHILDMNAIADLNRAQSPVYDTSSSTSLGTCSTAVFSMHEDSNITKPTTVDPGHPTKRIINKGKQKAVAESVASLSGTHGSALEAEVERRESRRHDLLAIGVWADEGIFSQHLKGGGRAKERTPYPVLQKQKKVEVVLTQGLAVDPPRQNQLDQVTVSATIEGTRDKNPPQSSHVQPADDLLRLAEEGCADLAACQQQSIATLSRKRVLSLVGLASLMILTLVVAGAVSSYTGRARLTCTKGIVFTATALLAVLIILAMLVARRVLYEALLAGLLELVFGFALMAELDDFL